MESKCHMAVLQASTANAAPDELTISTTDDGIHARLGGEFTDPNATRLVDAARELCSPDRRQFYVDMGEVTYTDSTGLNALVLVRMLVRAHGGIVTLCDVPARVLRLLEITALTSVFVLHGAGV